MTIFTCSDTFEGILCGVYDAWMSKLGHANVKLEIENRGNIQMFAQYRTVEVTSEKTEKVISVICKKAGDQVYEQVYRAFLSGEEEKADAIYRYLVYAITYGRKIVDQIQIPAVYEIFRIDRMVSNEAQADAIYRYLVYAITYGKKIADQIQIPAVYEIFRIDRMVSNEAHYLIEFLRFGNTRDGILFGTVGPKNDVIVLLAPHFADRLRGENWVIYDEKRKKAVVHQAEQPWFMVQLDDDSWKERLEDSNDQNAFECLWKTYHEHIAIRERINPRCQMNHLPLRFRPYMTEFQVVAEHER